MKDRVSLEATYPHSPERVWEALTDPNQLSRWLMPTDFKPLIGFRFRLDRPGRSAIEGKVIEVEPGKRLAYTWNDDEEGEGIVAWRLEPTDDGTRVRMEHIPVEAPIVNCIAIDLYFNWRHALKYRLPHLLRMLAHRVPPPIVYVEEKVEVAK